MNTKITGIILTGFVALLLGGYFSVFGPGLPVSRNEHDPNIEGFLWPKQKILTEFELVDHNNQPYRLERLKDKWRFVFFGYTNCPDICPTTMRTIRKIRKRIIDQVPDRREEIGFVFISVDGERDTPRHLNTYLNFFGDYFEGATGNKQQINKLTSQLGIPYSIDEHALGETDYRVGHSGAIFLISPQGSLASIYQPPLSPEDISDRFLSILEFMETKS